MTGHPDDEDQLRQAILGCPWMLRILATVRSVDLPDAWVGAGVVRDLVWGERYGHGFDPADVNDIDVVFFDPTDLGRDRDEAATQRLRAAWAVGPAGRPGAPARPAEPEPHWQARNQAAVHTWYATRFGGDPVAPFASIAEAVTTWPETATAVAVRLTADDRIEVCAPLGLADLLTGVWRRNPARASLEVSLARFARHDPATRWPGVRIIAPW